MMVFTAGQRSIMAEIISYYGHESQKMMLLEEMSELQKITNEKLHCQLRRIEDEKIHKK